MALAFADLFKVSTGAAKVNRSIRLKEVYYPKKLFYSFCRSATTAQQGVWQNTG